MDRIPVAGPWITELESQYAADAAGGDWYAQHSRYIGRFEKAFAEYVGVKHAVTVPHCTAAIHLSLAALGVSQGDQVIVPDVTWIASAAPIAYVGAEPVFADIDADTWCIDAASLEACITPRTKAVIAVDLYGSMPDCAKVRDVCTRHNIALVEDAAEAVGSAYHDRMAGSLGDTGVFSFHGSKTLATGEGGMFVTDDDAIHKRVMFLRDHGRIPGDRFFRNTEVAFKYKMSAMQAAVGLAQLERIDELVGKKRQLHAWYAAGLEGVPGIALNAEPEGTRNSYWMVTLVVDRERYGLDSEALMAALDQRGIDTRPFFHPLSSLEAYRSAADTPRAQATNTTGQRVSTCGINLPSALCLEEQHIARVCDAVRDVLGAHVPPGE